MLEMGRIIVWNKWSLFGTNVPRIKLRQLFGRLSSVGFTLHFWTDCPPHWPTGLGEDLVFAIQTCSLDCCNTKWEFWVNIYFSEFTTPNPPPPLYLVKITTLSQKFIHFPNKIIQNHNFFLFFYSVCVKMFPLLT